MASFREKLRKKSISYGDAVFSMLLIIAVLKAFLAFSELIPKGLSHYMNDVFNVIFLACGVYKLFVLQKYFAKQIFYLLLVGAVCVYSDFSMHRFLYIPDFIILASTQSIDFKKSMKLVWKIEALLLSIHILIYPFMYLFFRDRVKFTVRGYNNDNNLRHQFLLQHSNVFSMLLLWTILAYLYANYEKLNKKKIVICWGIYIFFYLFTNSNSGMMIISFVSIVLLLKDVLNKWIERGISFLSRYIYIILAAFFNFMMVIYTYLVGFPRIIWKVVDSFFTGRLKYGAYAYAKYGITLFGQNLNGTVRDYWEGFWIDGLPNDNMYMFFSVSFGLVFMLMIAFLFWRFADRASTDEKIIIIAYSLYTMMESYVIDFHFCFALILLMKYIWGSRAENNYHLRNKGNVLENGG
jgi:hypothetical protein